MDWLWWIGVLQLVVDVGGARWRNFGCGWGRVAQP